MRRAATWIQWQELTALPPFWRLRREVDPDVGHYAMYFCGGQDVILGRGALCGSRTPVILKRTGGSVRSAST